jgi:hypothetical protein
MPSFLVEISYHHSSDKTDYKALLDVPDGADPDVHAVLLAINDEYGIDADRDAGAVIAALEAAKKTGEHAKFEVRDSEEDDDLYEYTIWYKGDNFGLGEGDGLNKYANVWLKVRPYEPDPAMRKRLEVLDREQLLAILLRTHAASYLSFPPDSAQS